jgi:hypothetical protein
MKKIKTDLPLNYTTIKTTKSRIEKGLLAIPVSLIDIFPRNTNKIFLVNEHGKTESKIFTPYKSSSRECRIGGLRAFYTHYNVADGEELVIQSLDDDKFRIIPERIFQKILKTQLTNFEKSTSENEMKHSLSQISATTNLSQNEVLKNEFVMLSKEKIEVRKFVKKNQTLVREKVPYSIRKILLELYSGKCQVTNFTFLTKNKNPYFELHHINPDKGNHLKNLLVVSPNTHAQFTHCNLEQSFDAQGWLKKIKFNDNEFNVFQAIDKLTNDFDKIVHF